MGGTAPPWVTVIAALSSALGSAMAESRHQGRLTASQKHRVLTRAAKAWGCGEPHGAWEILHASNLDDHWPTFLRYATRRARERYTTAMSHYERTDLC